MFAEFTNLWAMFTLMRAQVLISCHNIILVKSPAGEKHAKTDRNSTRSNDWARDGTAFITARAIYAAAKLGVADILVDGAKSAKELAEHVDADAGALHRLLNFLSGLGVFHQNQRDEFSLTPLGETLVSNHSNSVRDFTIMFHEIMYPGFVSLTDSLRSGASTFEQANGGKDLWEYLRSNPEATRVFQAGLANRTRINTSAIMEACDFANDGHIMDVGGGSGALVLAIVKQHQKVSCTLFDQASAIEYAEETFTEFRGRCDLVAGDFFQEVPSGANTYILKLVLHDWYDDDSLKILKNCRAEISKDGQLLVIEGLISPPNELTFTDLSDLNMLNLVGGYERTEDQYASLFDNAGFRLKRVVPTTSMNISVMLAEPN